MAASVNISGGDKWKDTLKPYVDNSGTLLKVGLLEGATVSGEAGDAALPVAAIAAFHEFGTAQIPARSFMRSTLEKRGKDWVKVAVAYLKANPAKIVEALASVGEVAAKDIQVTIEAGIAPALKPATIKAKMRRGKTKEGKPELPLVDTGAMQEAITYEVTP